jgi:hypothetical protein
MTTATLYAIRGSPAVRTGELMLSTMRLLDRVFSRSAAAPGPG